VANQAIALQARAPQSNFLGPAIQQGAQMVNMMRQREAADLQAAATNQQLEIARARETREALAAQQESAHNLKIRPLEISTAEFANLKAQLQSNLEFITLVNNEIKNAKTPEAVIGAAAELKRRYPTQGQYIDRAVAGMKTDPVGFETWRMQSVFQSQDAKDQMAKTDIKQGEDGRYYMVEYGPRVKPSAFEIPTYKLDEPQGAQGASARPMAAPANPIAAAPANAMAPAPAPANPMAAAPMPGPNTNPVGGAPLNIQSGNMFQPASMTAGPQMGGAQPNLSDIVNEAMSSRQISQSNLQMIRDVAGPDKDAQLIQLLKAENIQIVPDAQTGMRSAMLRGGEAEDMLQQTQSREGYTATGQPFRGKPPMQGPYPGSALVPPSVLAAQAGAEARARGDVERSLRKTPAEIQTEAEATARGAASVKRPKETAQAYSAMAATLAKYDQTIRLAETLRDSKGLDGIVGNIEGNIPAPVLSLTSQEKANALAKYDSLLATAGFRELQQLRDASETGGALGNVSNAENTLTQNAAFTTSRTQSKPEFVKSLNIYIDELKGSQQRLKDAYKREYGTTFSVRPGAIGPLAGISPLRRSGGPEYKAPSPARGSDIDALVKKYGKK
jgi:hypothetical protein